MVKIIVVGSIKSVFKWHSFSSESDDPTSSLFPSSTNHQSACNIHADQELRIASQSLTTELLPSTSLFLFGSFHFYLFHHNPEIQDDLECVCLCSLSGTPFFLFSYDVNILSFLYSHTKDILHGKLITCPVLLWHRN